MAGFEIASLELERGADVDRLAIAPHILECRHTIPLDVVTHAAGERDFLRQRIRAADVQRIIVTLAQCRQRTPLAPLRADCNTAREALQRIADPHNRALAAAQRGIGILDAGDITRDRETLPAERSE